MRSTSGSGFWIWCSPPSRMCTCGSIALVSCRMCSTPGCEQPRSHLSLLADRDEVAARPRCARFQDLRGMAAVIPHVRRQRGVLAVKIVLHTAREQSPGLVGNVNFDVGIYCQ